MPPALEQVAAYTVAILVLLSPAWIYLVKRWVDSRISEGVKHEFATRLEDHRHGLELLTEEVRFDHQRRIHDFTLYVSKKHEVIAQLYELVRQAEGAVANLSGLRYSPTFEEYNESDILRFMEEKGVVEGKRLEIIQLWRQSRRQGVVEIEKYLRILEIGEARAARQRAINYLLSNELYLSEEGVESVDSCFDVMGDLIIDVEFPRDPRQSRRSDRVALSKAVRAVGDLLRREISAGYYVDARRGKELSPSASDQNKVSPPSRDES